MQPLSRRGVALLATTAVLGAGSLTTVAQAASAATVSNNAVRTDRDLDALVAQALGLLGILPLQTIISTLGLNSTQIGSLLAVASPSQLTTMLSGASPLNLTQLTNALSTLSPVALGGLIAPLSGGNLSTVLGAVTSGQLNGALATLTPAQLTTVLGQLTSLTQIAGLLGTASPAQLTGLLGTLTPAQLGPALALLDVSKLTTVVGALAPAQITSLLGQAGAPTSLVTGLTGRSTQIAASPNATDVNGLLAQVQALLGAGTGVPSLPGVDGLLNAIKPLLGVAGVDTSLLTGLLATLNATAGATLPEPLASAVQGVIGSAQTALVASGAVAAPGTTTPATTTKPASTAKPATTNTGQAAFRAYRASVSSIKVAKNRKTAAISVSCPASAPKGCLVTLDGVVAGKKAFAQKAFVVLRSVTQSVTVKLTSAAASRLKKKGGSLTVSAKTVNASLAAISKTVKVAKPAKKAAR